MTTDTDRDLITKLVHHPYVPPAGFGAVPPGVYKASTVTFANVAALRQTILNLAVRRHHHGGCGAAAPG